SGNPEQALLLPKSIFLLTSGDDLLTLSMISCYRVIQFLGYTSPKAFAGTLHPPPYQAFSQYIPTLNSCVLPVLYFAASL
ncbi:MAG: hypothetical protein V4543_18395, partial [Bacteroidota bacterium]